MDTLEHIKAIVFDWAGTMIDHGSRAPAIVFQEVFRQKGIAISMQQAREPMGRAKREHIAAITQMPEVQRAWEEQFGAPCSPQDVDAMYEQFLPLQKETLRNHSVLIDGAAEVAKQCRQHEIKIGSSTGYTQELMVEVAAAAKEQGYEPDCILGAEDAPRGRPAPFLLFEAAKRLDVYPMSSVVKVDDTPVGIQAGINAGCWTVGILRTGNCLGLSKEEVDQLSKPELSDAIQSANETLFGAGAHFTIESVTDLFEILPKINSLISQGHFPNAERPA